VTTLGGGARHLDVLRTQLRAHEPVDAAERRSLARTLRMLDWLRDPLDEHADPVHVTGSAIVRDGDGRILLHRHKRLGIWLQPGGHLDPGEMPWDGAVHETHEETGVVGTHADEVPTLVHVDVHEGPRGHVHLDLRYLLHADGTTAFAPAAGESRDIAWCHGHEAIERGDASLRAALAAAGRHPAGRTAPRHVRRPRTPTPSPPSGPSPEPGPRGAVPGL
jgi:ADP-ribose pyrophosphatase YjhB (NUDIX family)